MTGVSKESVYVYVFVHVFVCVCVSASASVCVCAVIKANDLSRHFSEIRQN